MSDSQGTPRVPRFEIPAGWRLLKVGEIIRQGDKFDCAHEGWIKTENPGIPYDGRMICYIRRVEAPSPAPKSGPVFAAQSMLHGRDNAQRLPDGSGFFIPAPAKPLRFPLPACPGESSRADDAVYGGSPAPVGPAPVDALRQEIDAALEPKTLDAQQLIQCHDMDTTTWAGGNGYKGVWGKEIIRRLDEHATLLSRLSSLEEVLRELCDRVDRGRKIVKEAAIHTYGPVREESNNWGVFDTSKARKILDSGFAGPSAPEGK